MRLAFSIDNNPMTKTHMLAAALLTLLSCMAASAKEVKDTLFSESGDRIILNYNVTSTNGQMTVRFTNVQKKLGQQNQKKYKKLEEVAVVFFDRTGNFTDMKFDGIGTDAFMIPANVTYTRSSDGYFLLQDCPTLQFNVAQNEEANLSIPIYLADYAGKRHYKVFAQCGNLALSSKQGKKNGGGGGGSAKPSGAAGAQQMTETVVTSEELLDEGLSPADEALIRANSIKSMLEQATKVPFSEELTHEAAMLRELRFKVTDEEVVKEITAALSMYDTKKQELEAQSDANQQAQAAQAAQQAQASQARNDSISAVQALQAAQDKKDLMWLIGGIAAVVLSFMGGKQIVQMVKQHKMELQQQKMMENMMKMTQGNSNPMAGLGGNGLSGIPGMEGMPDLTKATGMPNLGTDGLPNMNEMTAAANGVAAAKDKVQQQARAMSKEAEAARQRLKELRAKKAGKTSTEAEQTPTQTPHPYAQASNISVTHPSLNDAIPAKYKRLAKRSDKSGQS